MIGHFEDDEIPKPTLEVERWGRNEWVTFLRKDQLPAKKALRSTKAWSHTPAEQVVQS